MSKCFSCRVARVQIKIGLKISDAENDFLNSTPVSGVRRKRIVSETSFNNPLGANEMKPSSPPTSHCFLITVCLVVLVFFAVWVIPSSQAQEQVTKHQANSQITKGNECARVGKWRE